MTDTSHTMPLLALDNVSVQIRSDSGSRTVLDSISFAIQRGESLALVGESGSGKSLCAQTIMGLLPYPVAQQVSGEIRFEGKHVDNDPAALHALRGKQIAMIFQEPIAALNPVQTIGQQLAEVYVLHFPELAAADVEARSIHALERVGIADALQKLSAYPHQLSGGQCQRVMIAMALAGEPALLIADEPSTALDVSTQQQLLQLLHDLKQQLQLAVLFITHDLGIVAAWCQRVAVLQQGRLCEVATTQQLFTQPQHPYTRQLLAAIAPAEIPPSPPDNQPVLLSVNGVHKQFAARKKWLEPARPPHEVLHDIHFSIQQGEILALVGESGCGKSTLGRALLWLDPPEDGDIIYLEKSLRQCNAAELRQLRREMQVIFQDTNESLNPRHTVSRILAEPLEIHGIGSAAERTARVQELLQLVELPPDSLHRFPHEFSGGQRQRIGIARAIALNPRLVVCDEAVSALDVSTQAQIIALLLKLKSTLGLSLLFITHDLNVVRRIADRVLVMQRGRIVEYGTTAQVFEHPHHAATRALLAAAPHIPQHWQEHAP